MKRGILFLVICGLMTTGAVAQKRTALIRKASVSPVIDGQVDAVWAEADPENPIDRAQEGEIPTLGEPGETTWQALWDWEGIYILLRVTDDDFYPNYEAGTGLNRWDYDSPELYFDVNSDLEDGLGPSTGGSGHYQFAPSFDQTKIDGTVTTDANGFSYAFLVDDPNYTAEYFIPLSALLDADGYDINLEGEVGFDISVHDRDLGDDSLRVAVWCNTGAVGDSWSNMDDCGIITFDEASISAYVEEINLTGGEITENNGKLQIQAEVLPESASNKNLLWTIDSENSTGKAKIDQNGVVTAAVDGEVTVTAAAVDGSYTEASTSVIITNQIVTMKDLNEIRNPYFDQVEGNLMPTGWTFWGGPDGAPTPYVADGIFILTPAELEDPQVGYYQVNQQELNAEQDIDYIYRFVAWADENRTIMTNFEDPGNSWQRYGYSEDDRTSWGGTESDWTFEITPEPTRYEFIVSFLSELMNENTIQKVSFQVGNSPVVVYLDSLELARVKDFDMIVEYTPVAAITVSGAEGATSVTLDATLQMSAEVLPAEADYLSVKWSVENGSGTASIDENGLLTPESVGKVTVIASAVDDSGVQGELEVSIGWAAGISQSDINRIKVYPNPAVNELNIILDRENSSVSIYNSAGMKLDEVEVRGTEYRLDIGGYAPGIYYIRTGSGAVKFVK
jgi:hypothetical protein